MKKALLLFISILLFAACGGNKKQDGNTSGTTGTNDSLPSTTPTLTLLNSFNLPQTVDLNADISRCNLSELSLLRAYVYACHGCYFMEAELERFFQTHTTWYYDMVDSLCWHHDIVMYEKDIRLSQEEQKFVAHIDQRIKQLRNLATDRQTGLTAPWAIKTLWQWEKLDTSFIAHLQRDNFVITPTDYDQLFNVYEENDYREVGSFVTTDLMLQLLHMYFAYAQKSLEKHVLRQRLSDLCNTMIEVCNPHDWDQYSFGDDEQLQELGRYAMPYFGVALELLGEDAPLNDETLMQQELANIRLEKPAMSPMLGWSVYFPYDMFKPRGYYDREEWSRTYFQAMQWLQLAGLNYNDEASLRRAVFMASMLNINADAAQAYEDIDGIISFMTGEPDNVSLHDIANMLWRNGYTLPQQAQTQECIDKVRHYITEAQKSRNRIRSKLGNPADSTVMFMPARHVADAEVLARMADETVNAKRAFPRGLDVLAVFGSEAAEQLLHDIHNDHNAWSGFDKELKRLKEERSTWMADETDKNIYNRWLATVVQLSQSKHSDKAPAAMRTKAWTRKDLNTSLASWAELKHDAILYAEQPMLAECGGGGGLPTPYVKGFVEPNLPFWKSMEQLCQFTTEKLKQHNALTEDLESKMQGLHDMVTFLRQATEKELAGQELSEDEYWQITRIGSTVEWKTLGLIYPDIELAMWDDVQGADRSIATVADVFTRNITGCDHCGILHVGTGRADAIYVMVRIGDDTYLTRGAVLSYRECVEPLGTRLTDEQWQKRLEKKNRYAVPVWMNDITTGSTIKVDESVFFSSGC